MLADDDGALRVHASFGVSREVVSRSSASFDETTRAPRLQGLLRNLEGASRLCPLVSQGRVIGPPAVARRARADISSDDEWPLSAFADQVAAPLENAQLVSASSNALPCWTMNARLYEAERDARREVEAAKGEAENRRQEAEAANLAK